MAVEEGSRRALVRRLEEVLGQEHAVTLMAHLPASDPLTKADLGALEERTGAVEGRMGGLEERMNAFEERFELRLETMEHRITAALRKEIIAQTRVFVLATVGALASIAAVTLRFGG